MGIKIISDNRKAFHNYHVLESFEAGIVLVGSEVKSLRDAHVQLKDSYVAFKGDELWLQNCHISAYAASSYNNHEPERTRKLLMHRREIDKIIGQLKERGLSLVPLKIYFKDGVVKLEVALVKGKKAHDKRQDIKKRDAKRELEQVRKSKSR
jgi:SsrA-binding protein